jgi:hypothetical protein
MSRNTELQNLRSTDSVERTLDVSLDELNILDGVTATADEINYLDGREPYLLACSGTVTTMQDDLTLALAHSGNLINAGDISSKTLTIPANSSVAFPVGTVFTVFKGTNAMTLAVTTDTLIGSTSITATSTSLIIKVASTTWVHIAGAY